MKNTNVLIVIMLLAVTASAEAANNFGPANKSDETNPNLAQAKTEYKAYLEQLKAMSAQYKQITGEVTKVLKEEGVPTWDENSGGIKMMPYQDQPAPATAAQSAPMPAIGSQNYGASDVLLTDREVIVRMDLSGFSKDNIKVRIKEGKELIVTAQRSDDLNEFGREKGLSYQRLERYRGSFERTVLLPVAVSETATLGKYENGVLTVRMARAKASTNEVAVKLQ